MGGMHAGNMLSLIIIKYFNSPVITPAALSCDFFYVPHSFFISSLQLHQGQRSYLTQKNYLANIKKQ